jgi:endonuclease/exonuclease/phosphatase family metal-dependent hydrolase
VEVDVQGKRVHAIVVHLGLIAGSRLRQVAQLQRFIAREVPDDAPLVVAGDFNDWGLQIKRMLAGFGLFEYDEAHQSFTYPARLPMVQLDHVYVRGLTPLSLHVPRGRIWWRMSDHLPLIAEFRL